ncbi:hypothetical protein CRUP_001783 [Coryphaenoides rupestris]|nr:hypothetical protein CRUP_001783 [Coryphaenoides rupestris]
MAETLTVALRVAEEAIEEAISKAEEFSDSLEKQNEARYLRDHKEDLIEELATTIVQKARAGVLFPEEGAKATSLPSWKSVDRLDNSRCVVRPPESRRELDRPADAQLARPSLLAKRKSLVFSALEKESDVVSAYDGMGSESGGDNNDNHHHQGGGVVVVGGGGDDEGGWGAALLQFHRKMSDETYFTDSQHDPEWTFTRHPAQPPSPPPSSPPPSPPSTSSHRHQHLPNQRRTPPYEPHAHPHPQQQSTDDGVFYQAHHHHRRYLQLHHHEGGPQLPPEALDVNFNPKENSGILLSALLKRSLSQDQPAAPPSAPAPVPLPGAPESPEELFFNSSPEVTERDQDTVGTPPDSLALGPPPLTPASPGPGVSGPSEGPLEEELRRPPQQGPVRSERLEQKTTAGEHDRQDEEEREEEDKGGKREEPGSTCERLCEDNMSAQHGGQAQGQGQGPSTELPNGSERDRRERLAAGGQMTGEEEEGIAARRERTSGSENGGTEGLSTDHHHRHDADLQRGKRPEKGGPGGRRPSKRQQRRGVEKKTETADAAGLSGSSASASSCSPAVTPSALQEVLSDGQQKYSAASLCSITTEVLKVYLAASAVYGLEGTLGDLEECARSISSGTTDTELAFLEDQVATAAAQVHHSELQISNIEARISALKTAGLNVTTCHRFSKYKPKPQTLDSSRHQRRKLPAPPLKDKLDQEQQALRP